MFSSTRFWSYCWGTAVSPRETFHKVASEEEKVTYGFAAVMLLSVPYSVAVLIGFLHGVQPTGYEPFLRIPKDVYYLWQTFFTIPVGLVGWVLFAGIAQVVSKSLGGKGSFEDSLAVLGFPFILMLPLSWLPEIAVMTFVPEWWTTATWEAITPFRVGISVLWLALVSVIALQQAQGLSIPRAVLAMMIALIPTLVLQMTYLH